MTCLLDTNAFSDLMREHPAVDARLAGLGEADTLVSRDTDLRQIAGLNVEDWTV